MEEIKKTEGQAATQPEGNGVSGRTFTQEEVNKIISERLAKERARGEAVQESAADWREQQLRERENRLTCQEFLREQGLREELLDILDTKDPEKFQAKAARLLELFPGADRNASPAPVFSQVTQGGSAELLGDPFAAAFGRKQ